MAKHKKVEKSFDDYIVVNESEEWLRLPIKGLVMVSKLVNLTVRGIYDII